MSGRKFLVAGSMVAAAFSTGLANSAVVGSGGTNPYSFSWSQLTQAGTTLTGNGSMTVSGFSTASLVVTVTLTNTSLLGGQGGERLTGFAFGIDPDAQTATFNDANDGGMVDGNLVKQLTGNLKDVEVCAWGGQNCQGGSNGGIFGNGGTDTFSLTLTTLTNSGIWGTSVAIEPVGLKYQTGYGSFEFTTTSTGTPSTTGVPEPSSTMLALLGLGLVGLSFRARRRQQGQ